MYIQVRIFQDTLEKVGLFLNRLAGKGEVNSATKIESARITSTKLKALKVAHYNCGKTKVPPKPVPDCSVKELGSKAVSLKRETSWAKLSHTRLQALSHYEE